MITNLKVQIVYRFIFLIIAFIGIYNALSESASNFLVKYTYLSNAICFIFMGIVFVFTVIRHNKGERNGNNEFFPVFKYMATVMILVTFIIYATMLESMFTASYWTDGQNLIVHFFVPLIFFLDWILFDKHLSLKLSDVPLALILPYIYVFYAMVRATTLSTYPRYPYSFLDIDENGVGSVMLMVFLLSIAFLLLGILMWCYDKFVKRNGKIYFIYKKELE